MNDIIDQLWNEISRMHGSLKMAEACRLIIYVLLMKHMDINKNAMLDVYDERFSVRYLARTYGELVDSDDVMVYLKKLEPGFIPGDGVVTAGFENLLKMADDSHVQMLFKSIDSIEPENVKLYEIASSLLDLVASTHGNGMVDASPNLPISRLEGRLLGCGEGMRVYDGFCGYGLSANEVSGGRGNLYMQDIDKDSVAIAAVLAILKGNHVCEVRCGDSLLDLLAGEKFDRIIIEPPLAPLANVTLALRHAQTHLADDGVAIALVPAGILFKSGKVAEMRNELTSGWLDAVIELPSGAIPNTRTAAALLILKKNRGNDDILMVKADDFFEKTGRVRLKISDENITRLAGIYERREVIDGISSIMPEALIIKKGNNLCTTQYVISDLQKMIMIEETGMYKQEYSQLAKRLEELDRQLDDVRSRFI